MGKANDKFKDIVKRAAKVAVGYIPGIGPVVSELIDYGASQLEQNKLNTFMSAVEKKLEAHTEQIEKLKSDEFGYYFFLKSTRRMMEESQKEKIELFAECVKNGYLSDLSESKKLFFLQKLTEYPIEQLELLSYLNENHFVDESTGSHIIHYGTMRVSQAICEGIPKFEQDIKFLEIFVQNLENDGFIKSFRFDIPESVEKAKGKWTTEFGEEFLNFIKEKHNG